MRKAMRAETMPTTPGQPECCGCLVLVDETFPTWHLKVRLIEADSPIMVTTSQPWNRSQALVIDPLQDFVAPCRSRRILEDSLICVESVTLMKVHRVRKRLTASCIQSMVTKELQMQYQPRRTRQRPGTVSEFKTYLYHTLVPFALISSSISSSASSSSSSSRVDLSYSSGLPTTNPTALAVFLIRRNIEPAGLFSIA